MILTKQSILYCDEELLILNKPAGLLSQPDDGKGPVAANSLKKLFGPRQFIAPVHRLDRNTSGTMLFAMNPRAAQRLSDQLQAGTIKRFYHAIVKGDPGKNVSIDQALRKDPDENKSYPDENGLAARTFYKRLQKFPTSSLVEAWLDTGRSHQIRVHFAFKGFPLIGDHKYAPKNWAKLMNRPALHAQRLALLHPVTQEEMLIEAPYPADFEKLLKLLLKIRNQGS